MYLINVHRPFLFSSGNLSVYTALMYADHFGLVGRYWDIIVFYDTTAKVIVIGFSVRFDFW